MNRAGWGRLAGPVLVQVILVAFEQGCVAFVGLVEVGLLVLPSRRFNPAPARVEGGRVVPQPGEKHGDEQEEPG